MNDKITKVLMIADEKGREKSKKICTDENDKKLDEKHWNLSFSICREVKNEILKVKEEEIEE